MPDLGQPLVKEVRRLAAAYAAWPGPETAQPAEVLEWHRAELVASADHKTATDRGPEVTTAPWRSRPATRRQVLGGMAAMGAAGALAVGGFVVRNGSTRGRQGGSRRRWSRWSVVHLSVAQ